MSDVQDTNDLRAGGFAPGDYYCRCTDCDAMFEGDKRALRCTDCARRRINEAAHLAQKDDDFRVAKAKLGGEVSDAEVMAALMSPDASFVPFEKHHRRVIHDFDLPAYVRAFVACNQGPASETMAINEAGLMPKLYATYTPADGSEPFRVRVTMVSRLGDVGVSRDDVEYGYFDRLSIYDLSEFDTVLHPGAPAKRKAPKVFYAIADEKDRWVRLTDAKEPGLKVALSAVPVLYERSKTAYRRISDIDPHGLKGLKVVPIATTVRRDEGA